MLAAERLSNELRDTVAWLAVGLREGIDSLLGEVIGCFGAARPHLAYVFPNRRVRRLKVLVFDGAGMPPCTRWRAISQRPSACHLGQPHTHRASELHGILTQLTRHAAPQLCRDGMYLLIQMQRDDPLDTVARLTRTGTDHYTAGFRTH